VRRLDEPTVFGLSTDTLFIIGQIADSIQSALPISFGGYRQPDADSTASVPIGVVRPDSTKSEAMFIHSALDHRTPVDYEAAVA